MNEQLQAVVDYLNRLVTNAHEIPANHPEKMFYLGIDAACTDVLEQIGWIQDSVKFEENVIIGSRDYEVIHTKVYGCGDEMEPEIAVNQTSVKPGQKVKVIIVKEDERD